MLLTEKQREIVVALANGQSVPKISKQTGLAKTAIDSRIITARKALGARTQAHLIALAVKHGDLTKEDIK